MTKKISLVLIFGLALSAPSMFANSVTTGNDVTPDVLTVGSGATLVASASGTFSSLTFTANYLEDVYSDPTNTYCAGCLDWIIRLSDTGAVGSGSGIIEHITASAFGTFLTDVGINTTGAPGLTATSGGIAPHDINRAGGGDVLSFNFADSTFSPGDTTDLLEIETNARGVVPGTLSAIDGGSAEAVAYGPTAVPEPVTMGLLGGGLALLGIARLRSKRNK